MNCSYGRMIDAPNKPSAFSVSEWVCAYVSMWMMQMMYNDHLGKERAERGSAITLVFQNVIYREGSLCLTSIKC